MPLKGLPKAFESRLKAFDDAEGEWRDGGEREREGVEGEGGCESP